jgi:Leucine-rich repeat (LRR) protein
MRATPARPLYPVERWHRNHIDQVVGWALLPVRLCHPLPGRGTGKSAHPTKLDATTTEYIALFPQQDLSDEDIALLEGLPFLREVSISRLPSPQAWPRLAHLNWPKRAVLRIHHSDLVESDFARLAQLARLQSLALDDCTIESAGLRDLARMPRLETHGTLPNLSHLDVTYTRIDDAGLDELKKLPRLSTLSLAGTLVTDAGAARLAGIQSLESLDVSCTKLTEVGLLQLTKLKRLRWLRVSCSDYQLKKKLKFHLPPNCHIEIPQSDCRP